MHVEGEKMWNILKLWALRWKDFWREIEDLVYVKLKVFFKEDEGGDMFCEMMSSSCG